MGTPWFLFILAEGRLSNDIEASSFIYLFSVSTPFSYLFHKAASRTLGKLWLKFNCLGKFLEEVCEMFCRYFQSAQERENPGI